MNLKAKYFAVFGLDESASKDQIRRAYRKLAMKYHPDKNSDPKAQQIFIDLAEAYDLIINDKIPNDDKKVSRNEKSFEDRKKDAEIRFKKQQKREKQAEEIYFKKLTRGRKFFFFKKITQIAAIFSFLLFLDFFLPRHTETHIVTSFSPKYNGLFKGQVICFLTDKNLSVFVNNPSPMMYTSHPKIRIERSWIFHNPIAILHKTEGNTILRYQPDFSVVSAFPIIPILLLIPILTLYFKRKALWFTVLYLVSFYFIGLFCIYFILYQDRWIHLLSLGFI